MTEIVVIAAVAQNGVIGNGSQIPWSIREDFLHFKRKTDGHPCIMGDVTFESLPPASRPLPGRENIVLTFDRDYHPSGTTVFYAFEDALEYVRGNRAPKAFIIGGASIYRLGVPVADTLELTRIHHDYAGDVTFPTINPDEWEEKAREEAEAEDRRTGQIVRLTYLTYRRAPR